MDSDEGEPQQEQVEEHRPTGEWHEEEPELEKLDSSYFDEPNSIYKTIRSGFKVQMDLTRDNSGFSNTFWPEFHLMVGERYIMSAKKTNSRPTSTFIISSKPEIFEEDSPAYLGKMKSNVMGETLNVFGRGLNPSEAQKKGATPR